MKKMKLNLDTLAVESFATSGGAAHGGTVLGAQISGLHTCIGQPHTCNTVGYTCKPSACTTCDQESCQATGCVTDCGCASEDGNCGALCATGGRLSCEPNIERVW